MDDGLREFTEYLKNTKKRTQNTVDAYSRDIMDMYAYMRENGINDLDKITYININSYILHMERQGKSASSITRGISSMKTFFHFLLLRGYIKGEPTELIMPPRAEKKQRQQSSAEIIDRLIAVIDKNGELADRDTAIIMLMTEAGMKVGEITEILMSDVNLSMGYITLKNIKAEKTYTISAKVKNALENYIYNGRKKLLKNDSEYLFISSRGKKLTRQGIWKRLKEYGEMAGISDRISPETLRK